MLSTVNQPHLIPVLNLNPLHVKKNNNLQLTSYSVLPQNHNREEEDAYLVIYTINTHSATGLYLDNIGCTRLSSDDNSRRTESECSCVFSIFALKSKRR